MLFKISTIYNKSGNGYDLYKGMIDGLLIYNIVPKGSKAPVGGYNDLAYIMYIKGFN